MKLKIEVNLDYGRFSEPDALADALADIGRDLGYAPRVPEDGSVLDANGNSCLQWEVVE